MGVLTRRGFAHLYKFFIACLMEFFTNPISVIKASGLDLPKSFCNASKIADSFSSIAASSFSKLSFRKDKSFVQSQKNYFHTNATKDLSFRKDSLEKLLAAIEENVPSRAILTGFSLSPIWNTGMSS